MEPILQQRMLPVIWRIRFRRTMVTLALLWCTAAAVAIGLYTLNQQGQVETAQWPQWLFWSTAAGTLLAATTAWYLPVTQRDLIRTIEARYPDLDSSLMTAVEQQPTTGQRLGFLQMDVLRKAVGHSYANNWAKIVPGWQLLTAPVAGMLGLAAFFIAILGLLFNSRTPEPDQTIAFADAAVDSARMTIAVEPGNTEVEQGTGVLVLARFPDHVPTDATLVYTVEGGDTVRRPMDKSLDDPVFGGRIENVAATTNYFVEYETTQSESFRINVFQYPELTRADAKLTFPEYTGQAEKTIQDVRRLTAVEGTQIQLEFFVNKTMESATLDPIADGESSEASPIVLTTDATDPRKYTATIELKQSVRYLLNLVDQEGRSNRVPPRFIFKALQNQQPKLKVVVPGRDVEASPLEEVALAAEAWDDFGVKAMGLSYTVDGTDQYDVELESRELKSKQRRVDHLLMLEQLGAEADDLISYYFWAEDFDANGEVRRIASDIYFIEVRPLEQIFRQGTPPPGGDANQPSPSQSPQQGNQNAQQAQQLAELQKQIISGTWNVIRRERFRDAVSGAFPDDVKTLSESQASVIESLEQVAQNVTDPRSAGIVQEIRDALNQAVTELDQAGSSKQVDPLQVALESEQRGYSGLLKLRAREIEVARQQQPQQQQQGQAGQQNSRAQAQLNELELKDDQNRYEQERTAQQPEDENPQAREDRQILNRLKDLARRQEDLNERIKELVTSLEEAKTEEEKEELERRLKSLREQQEQMIRDADELLQRMEEPDNQQRMSEESQQLSETRENLRKAAESLDKREVSQAAAEGTRAQRDLENLRDEFKERAAGQFTEEMREMRNRAQEIEQKQQEIAEEMRANDPTQPRLDENPRDRQPERARLDEDAEPRDLEAELAEQQKEVEQLRESMRETIQEAETVEPLLAESLYDTYRQSEANRPDQALEETRRSLSRGWMNDALQQQETAQQGIEQLREGIEQAAEKVLGDPTEALRSAQRSLDRLNEGVESEISEATGEPSDDQQPGSPTNRSQTGDSEEASDPQDQDSQSERPPGSGQPQPGERSEQQPGQQQPGQQPGQQESEQPSDSQSPQNAGQRPGQSGGGQPSEEPSEQSPESGQDAQQQQSESQQQESQNAQSGQQQSGGGGGGNRDGERPEEDQQRGGRDGEQQGDRQEREQQNQLIQQLGGRNTDNAEDGNPNAGSRTLNAGNQRMMRPISGDDFREFYDELRDVEEMLDDPDLRAEAARIREQARELRKDQKERHSAEPNWDLVKLKVLKPMRELQDKVAEEILRRTSKDARVPINREPIPAEYQDAVRRYYERLGVGQ